MLSVFTLLLSSRLIAPASPSGPACLRYEPDTVAITGKLVRRTFYGAPGFGEDPKHDTKETGYYLALGAALCTIRSRDNDAAAGVKLVQLVLDSADYARLRPKIDHTVTLRGTLFAAFTGHHHAPVLLTPVRSSR